MFRFAQSISKKRLQYTALLASTAVFVLAAQAMTTQATAETILRRGNAAEPNTLDLHRVSGVPEANIQLDLYEGLMTYSADGKPIPGVAESYTLSPDGMTYTFKLRANAKWSDGTPVTSEDFAFAWRRILNPKTAANYAYFLDCVKNAEAIRNGKAEETSLGIETPNANTFIVHLNAPTPYFIGMLVHHSTYPINKALYEKQGDAYAKPGILITNGAYKLAEAIPQDHVTLVKNTMYHDAANVQVDKIIYYPTEDANSELKRYQAGELDVTYNIPLAEIPVQQKQRPNEARITPYFGTYFYAFNLTHEPWKSNKDLRHALSLAIDRDVIVKNITQAGEIPAYSFVPPGTSNFAVWTPDEAKMSQAERDAKAKDLLAKAGYSAAKPLALEFAYNTSEAHKKVAVAVAAMWKQKLGADVNMKNQEWSTFQAERNNKAFQDIARHGWIGDFDDATNFLDLQRGNIGAQSTSGYKNADFDRLMAEATTEKDLTKRALILQQAEKIMIAELPIIPIYFYASKNMVSPKINGWVDNLSGFHLTRWMSLKP